MKADKDVLQSFVLMGREDKRYREDDELTLDKTLNSYMYPRG